MMILPLIYRVWAPSQGGCLGFLNHQQSVGSNRGPNHPGRTLDLPSMVPGPELDFLELRILELLLWLFLQNILPPKKYVFFSENSGVPTPKSSILNRGFPLFSPSILGVFPLFLETPISKHQQNLGVFTNDMKPCFKICIVSIIC